MKRIILAGTKEYIEGMSKEGFHYKPNFCIVITPDNNRQGVCYFKYLDSDDYSKAENIARISFRGPERIYHKDGTGKKEWKLAYKDKKELCTYLMSRDNNFRHFLMTHWQHAIYLWNLEKDLLRELPPEEYISKEHAFVEGFYDTDDNLKNPSYVPSYQEMPDYMLLESGK